MNPRKLAKLGFVNASGNKISCESCRIGATMKSHFNFSTDEKAAKANYQKIKDKVKHFQGCQIKFRGKFPFKEMYQSRLDSDTFVILSRKLF